MSRVPSGYSMGYCSIVPSHRHLSSMMRGCVAVSALSKHRTARALLIGGIRRGARRPLDSHMISPRGTSAAGPL